MSMIFKSSLMSIAFNQGKKGYGKGCYNFLNPHFGENNNECFRWVICQVIWVEPTHGCGSFTFFVSMYV